MVLRLSRLKPGGKRKTHILLSACLWTVIGVLLLTKGFYRISLVTLPPITVAIIVALAATSGVLKSYFVLDKAANKSIERILAFKDDTCLGAVYSIKTWLLVLCMMGMGALLRNSTLPVILLVFIYITVGSSLLISSRFAWMLWFKNR